MKERIIGGIVTGLLALYTVSLALFGVLVLIIGVWLNPIPYFRKKTLNFLQRFPYMWSWVNHYLLQITNRNKLHLIGTDTLKKHGWYVLVSNHQNWADILLISTLFRDRIPVLKFFMKKSLMWRLPFAGILCYYLGYPMMNRHTRSEIKKNPALKGQDILTTKQLCAKFREHPTTIINFVEGTRFTKAKQARQQSPFHHLLKPKAGGVAIVIEELHDILDGIINVTIKYKGDKLNVWNFVCGRYQKIEVHYEVLPITPNLVGDYHQDREFRAQFQQWLNQVWARKDQQLEERL